MLVAKLFVVFAVSLVPLVLGKEYVVGDEDGWNSTYVDYYAWAANNTFYVGDILVFNYAKEDHNVIVVNATGYDGCVSYPNMGSMNSGNDKVTLKTTGYKYYICQWHCDYSDQKLNVTVLPK